MSWWTRLGIFSVLSVVLMSGCQSFRYYDPAKPHRGKDRFYNNYDNSPSGNFFKWQWDRLTQRSEPPPLTILKL